MFLAVQSPALISATVERTQISRNRHIYAHCCVRYWCCLFISMGAVPYYEFMNPKNVMRKNDFVISGHLKITKV